MSEKSRAHKKLVMMTTISSYFEKYNCSKLKILHQICILVIINIVNVLFFSSVLGYF